MKKKILIILGILCVLILSENGMGIPCIFHELTGLYCPGCGATRAVISLIKLSPYQAFRYNLLIIISIPFIVGFLIYKYVFHGKRKIPDWILYILLMITILYGILRNIPVFSYFMPTKIL